MIQHKGRCLKAHRDIMPSIKAYVPSELQNNCPCCNKTGEYKNRNKFGMTRMVCRDCNEIWIL